MATIDEQNRKIKGKPELPSYDPIDPITQINSEVFLGQGRVTLYGPFLSQLGITHVVSIGRAPHDSVRTGPFYKFELQGALDVEHENLAVYFPAIFKFMREAIKNGGKILCHCEAGCSRSPTVIIAFLRATGAFDSLQHAYDYVKAKRPWINPNAGFIQQLREFFSEPLGVGGAQLPP